MNEALSLGNGPFGNRRVSTITPERVEAYIRRLSDEGMAAGTGPSV